MVLVVGPEHWLRLREHLFQGEAEWVAFLFARPPSENEASLVAERLFLVPAEQHEFRSPFHVELRDDVRPFVIKEAWDHGHCLVEAHSHRTPGEAVLSPTDLDSLNEFVPHVMWRLPGRPYCALVLAESTLDGLVWKRDPRDPAPLEGVRVGDDLLEPTRRTWGFMEAISRREENG